MWVLKKVIKAVAKIIQTRDVFLELPHLMEIGSWERGWE